MISSGQIRAARALLRWSSADLAEASGVSQGTIKRLELMEGVPLGSIRTLTSIKAAFEQAGVDFIGTPDNGPGVRICPQSAKEKSS